MLNIQGIMKQAQAMQKKMEDMQERLAQQEVTGVSGGGMVKVTMSGKFEMKKVEIDKSLIVADEADILEDLIVAAAKETGKVVTVEEHSVIGGLGSAVCDALAEKCPVPVKKIGVQDVFGESGPAVALLAKYKLDGEGVYEHVKEFCK